MAGTGRFWQVELCLPLITNTVNLILASHRYIHW
jgi:hypothetical protein